MADKTWFDNLQDTADLANEMMAKTPDLYVQEYLVEANAVYSLAGQTFTVSTASWTVDAFISTVANNIQVVDDAGKVAMGKITDNDATTVTVVIAAVLLEEDATTAATFTDTDTYKIRILTPSSIAGATYGPFFGYTEGNELQINDEMMKFKYSQPMKLIAKDLKERAVIVQGGNVDVANSDVIATIFNAETYGLNTGFTSLGIGSNPDVNKTYRLTFDGQDRNGRAVQLICRRCQFEANGNIFNATESGHKMYNFISDAIADGFYPDDVDLIQYIKAD